MTDEEVKNLIDATVKRTVKELKTSGLVKSSDSVAYEEVTEILRKYYAEGKKDSAITYAITSERFDPYFSIIQKFFEEGKTIEVIAEEIGVDISTIIRNKKRLCIDIYNKII